jgi:hypothetical protein
MCTYVDGTERRALIHFCWIHGAVYYAYPSIFCVIHCITIRISLFL